MSNSNINKIYAIIKIADTITQRINPLLNIGVIVDNMAKNIESNTNEVPMNIL